MADIECRRGRNYAYFINFVPYFGQLMSVHRLKCLARCLIVTKTSFHAGFWCLSRIKRSTRSPNRKTFGDVRHLWLPFSDLLGTCGLQFGAAHLWSETNFFRDSNPCGLHSRASYNPTNTVLTMNTSNTTEFYINPQSKKYNLKRKFTKIFIIE